jgi:hypothetical protein
MDFGKKNMDETTAFLKKIVTVVNRRLNEHIK